jgi:hypothetical protein
LLSALETGVSDRSKIQAAAVNLAALLDKKLVHCAGPLQDILNDDERREMFARIHLTCCG